MSTIRVLSAGAVRRALTGLAKAFGAENDAAVEVTFATAPDIRTRLADGTGDLDLVCGPVALIDELAAAGRLDAATRATLGGVKAAVAVPADAPDPDIASPEGLRTALRAADLIVFNRASSGQYIERMIEDLGVMAEVAERIRRFDDAEAAMRHLGAEGTARSIGFGQSSAIRVYEPLGVRQAGPLPEPVGNVTTYDCAVTATAPDPEGARALAAFLVSARGRAAFRASGVE